MNKQPRKINSVASELLRSRADLLGVVLTAQANDLVHRYLLALEEYNEHTNLVSNADPEIVISNHVIDALTLVPIIETLRIDEETDSRLIDIGSGAGFPGIIIAIAMPDLSVTLVDSIGKKTRFLSEVVDSLGLAKRVRVETARGEELGRDPKFRERFDFATARAVGVIGLIAELCLPLVKVGGYLLAQKSRLQLESELASAGESVRLLGGAVEKIEAPNTEATNKDVVVALVKKTASTPAKYPRPSAQLKRPLP